MTAVTKMRYRKSPIIESVVEFRFAEELTDAKLRKLNEKFRKKFPDIREQKEFEVHLNIDDSTVEKKEKTVTYHADEDQQWLIGLDYKRLICSHKAPYGGFEDFFAHISYAYEAMSKVAARRKLERVGMRYINRIDLPVVKGQDVAFEKYLNLKINIPEFIKSVTGYEMVFTFNLPEIVSACRVSSSVRDNVLINHASFFIDIDIFKEHDFPANEFEVLDYISGLQSIKNELFESFITDPARDMFNASDT